MRSFRFSRCGPLVVVVILAAATTGAGTPGNPAAISKWSEVSPVPLPSGFTNSVLEDVAASGPGEVWAVGSAWTADRQPFVLHGTGTSWEVGTLPRTAAGSYLTAVDAVAIDDVWAAGAGVTLLHFDGTAWSTAPAPAAAPGTEDDLEGLDLRTADDGWAVGDTVGGSAPVPLVLRLQHGRWVRSAAPKIVDARLTSVESFSATDAWAAGTRMVGGVQLPLVLHWDGVAWTEVTVPAPAGTVLNSVAGIGPSDLWAAGTSCRTACSAVVLHLLRGRWESVPVSGGTEVTEVLPVSATAVWTVGFDRSATGVQSRRVEFWNGTGFTREQTPLEPTSTGGGSNGEPASAAPLAGATADPVSGSLWAVGWSQGVPRLPRIIRRD
ncbi:hypothetical protein AB0368_07790 [Actinoplanes sp. NPDC051475]|uniref:hypothetical protein n=1 Tax=Actinoplanes sp. NPDC051475 TaxID=3157225 RepID=UPI00344D1AFE